MKIFTVTLNGKDYEVRQGDDGVFSLPDSLAYVAGVGTALKPAIEPIILARKPLSGTVAQNVLAHGVGGLNIDACRVGMSDADREAARVPQPVQHNDARAVYQMGTGEGRNGATFEPAPAGRFPANVLLDEHAATEMDKQSGVSVSRVRKHRDSHEAKESTAAYGDYGVAAYDRGTSDEGGASRFFPVFKYQAKAPKKERPVIERPPMLQLRDDLTPEQVDHVLARLAEAGVRVD